MKAAALKVEPSAPGARSAADDFYDTLLAGTSNTRKRNNLAIVKKALDMMRETKAGEYSIAAVARAISALGHSGPKEQSIRNKEAKEFRDLIAAFAAEHQAPPKAKRGTSDEDLIASIPDHRIAARVQWIMHQNQSLQRRIDILHAQFKKLAAVELTPEGIGPKVNASRDQFTDMEIKAVCKFLSSVGDLDCSFDSETGALLHDRHGLEMAAPGFQQALLKIANTTGKNK